MQDHKDSVLFVRSMGRGRTLCVVAMHVTDSAWNVFEITRPCSISKIEILIKYYSSVIFILTVLNTNKILCRI
jgi:hypothetical protein